MNNLGVALDELGDYQKPRSCWSARCPLRQAYGPEHVIVAGTLRNLGCTYGELGDYRKQKELLARAVH